MDMGDVEGGPMQMVRRYAIACRMCRIDADAQGPAFFAAIFGDNDSAMPDMNPDELVAWRKYVCGNVPMSGHGPGVTTALLVALECLSRG
jgi:hypothetical protein